MNLQFEPQRWHTCTEKSWQVCTEGVNCYSYALNNPDYHWAVPGLGFAITETQRYYDSFRTYFAGMSKEDFRRHLINGAVKDGLTKVTTPEDRIGHYLVALAFPEGDAYDDFHWYRKDDNGTWSHKYGRHAPSNTDSDGKIITDPRDAARPDYPAFSGFFLVPRQGVELEQSFPLIPEAQSRQEGQYLP